MPYKLPFVEQSLWQHSFMFSRENVYQNCRLVPAAMAVCIGEVAEIGETLLNKEPTLILPVTHLRSFRSQCCMLHWHALEKQTACNATQNHAKFSLPLHAGVSLVIVRSFCRNPNLPCHVILILPYLDDNWFRHHRTTLSCFTDYHSA